MVSARSVARHMSAGVILVDRAGRVLLQLRDDDPEIMFPGHWGLTGGAALPGETPEQTARREVREETGIALEAMEPFRAYYTNGADPKKRRTEYELYLFHAPCDTAAGDMTCGEGRALRFFAPDEIDALDVAYNHREVLHDFFTSPAYARYVSGAPFDGEPETIDPVEHFTADLRAGTPWFDALMAAIALWERPAERVGGREYRYLLAGEAFDWLLLAERLVASAPGALPADEVARLLFEGRPPSDAEPELDADRLRALIGETKHRAHLNYLYGVVVEEALQYAAELEVAKERVNVAIRDAREGEVERDPVYERIYGQPRHELLREFRAERGAGPSSMISVAEHREFLYWLFKYRVKNQEPARVASDTRKALAQLSAIEMAARRRRARAEHARTDGGAPSD